MQKFLAPTDEPVLLVVQHDPSAREGFARQLCGQGFRVVPATGALEAVALLLGQRVDLVLCDLALPELDGVELTKRVRELGLLDLPIVLRAEEAEGAIERAAEGLDLGADDYVASSLGMRALVARLRAHLRRTLRQAELTRSSILDPLTHLLNRRGIDQVYARELARLQRRGGAISLLVLDVDDLKPVNDRHGHAAGDLILQALSRALERAVRATDHVGRLGGDEFVVVMPETHAEAALKLAERVRALQPLKVTVGARIEPVSFSVGLASGDAQSALCALLAVADAAMYRQKRAAHAERPTRAGGRRATTPQPGRVNLATGSSRAQEGGMVWPRNARRV